jgi:hypothetical protein
VVVLLVLLLLVMVLRKRGSASGPSKAKAKPDARAATLPRPGKVVRPPIQPTPVAKAGPAPKPAPETATSQPGIIEPDGAETATAAPAEAVPSVAASAAVRHEVPRVDMAQHTDPLHAVIVDILQGWGDITEDDTKRLALFRPEKVLAAAQAMETPKELKSNQHARTRLNQLRQYAANRVDQARAQQAASAAAEASAAEPEAEAPATAPEPIAPVASVFGPQPKATETQPATAFHEVEEAETPLVETDYADELSTWPEAHIEAEPAVYSPLTVPVETQFEAPAETPAEAPTEIPAETPAETPAEVSLEAVQESPFETAAKPAVDPMAAEMPLQESSWLQQDTQAAPTGQAESEPAFLDEPESSLSSLHVSIKTADELLALPEHERPEMVAFLEPAELAKVFDGTNDDLGLKKAIIDTLEHVSNPASLEVLRRCLDDPDPQIQLYALEAADRLLGVD